MKRIPGTKIKFFQQEILAWFESNGRHRFPWRKEGLSPFEIVIAEVLLQRTKAETVEKFYEGFLLDFPAWERIANAPIEEIEERLKPVGLYRQRAKRLKDLAVQMVQIQGEFPAEREELEKIPFLGQYIVNAIELQIFQKPSPLIDVNMSRVLERFFGERKMADIRYDPYLQELSRKVVNIPNSKEISWAILDFAALICKARKPLCSICCVKNKCLYYAREQKMRKFA
jgi:A/G-specific adenine glycosylase